MLGDGSITAAGGITTEDSVTARGGVLSTRDSDSETCFAARKDADSDNNFEVTAGGSISSTTTSDTFATANIVVQNKILKLLINWLDMN